MLCIEEYGARPCCPAAASKGKLEVVSRTCAWNELCDAYRFASCNWLGALAFGALAYCDILVRFWKDFKLCEDGPC